MSLMVYCADLMYATPSDILYTSCVSSYALRAAATLASILAGTVSLIACSRYVHGHASACLRECTQYGRIDRRAHAHPLGNGQGIDQGEAELAQGMNSFVVRALLMRMRPSGFSVASTSFSSTRSGAM